MILLKESKIKYIKTWIKHRKKHTQYIIQKIVFIQIFLWTQTKSNEKSEHKNWRRLESRKEIHKRNSRYCEMAKRRYSNLYLNFIIANYTFLYFLCGFFLLSWNIKNKYFGNVSKYVGFSFGKIVYFCGFLGSCFVSRLGVWMDLVLKFVYWGSNLIVGFIFWFTGSSFFLNKGVIKVKTEINFFLQVSKTNFKTELEIENQKAPISTRKIIKIFHTKNRSKRNNSTRLTHRVTFKNPWLKIWFVYFDFNK